MENLSALNNFGVSKSVIETPDKSPLTIFLQKELNVLIEEIKSKGLSLDVRASNSLLQSIVIKKIEQQGGGGLNAEITANEYWKFINFGVNGLVFSSAPNWASLGVKQQSFEELEKSLKIWIPFRGLQPRENQTFDELATALAISIGKKGKVPRPFITETIKQTKSFKRIAKGVAEITGKAVAVSFITQLKNTKNGS